jgi:hypothetical protein
MSLKCTDNVLVVLLDHINDNIQLTAGYKATVGEAASDLEMDTFLFSLVFGWHSAVEGMERLAE